MDDAAARVFERYASSDEKVRADVKEFVDGCKYHCTGNWVWSLQSARYGVDLAEDGSGDVVLTL
jgi:hypothetical protein